MVTSRRLGRISQRPERRDVINAEGSQRKKRERRLMHNAMGDVHGSLDHVLWLGGAPDAGKSSVVKALGERYAFRWYNFDYFEPQHFERMRGGTYPATEAFLALTLDERWVLHSPEEMAHMVIALWRERFPLVIEDLLAWPRDRPIIAEGPGLFPEDVIPYLSEPQRGLWLVPTPAFKRTIFVTRENKVVTAAQTCDPERAQRNMIERDLLMGAHIMAQARVLGLEVFPVDGSRTVADMAALVDALFAPHLRAR